MQLKLPVFYARRVHLVYWFDKLPYLAIMTKENLDKHLEVAIYRPLLLMEYPVEENCTFHPRLDKRNTMRKRTVRMCRLRL